MVPAAGRDEALPTRPKAESQPGLKDAIRNAPLHVRFQPQSAGDVRPSGTRIERDGRAGRRRRQRGQQIQQPLIYPRFAAVPRYTQFAVCPGGDLSLQFSQDLQSGNRQSA